MTPTSVFSREVREFLQAGTLTYSSRQELLKSAKQRQIPRFEANLIIAAIQHRLPPHLSHADRFDPATHVWIAIFALAQLILVVLTWALLLH